MKHGIKFEKYPIEQRKIIVRDIIKRMGLAYEVNNKEALAQTLNVAVGTLRNWGVHGYIPMSSVLQCHMETGMSLDWLVHTVEPTRLNQPTDLEVAELAAIIHRDIAYSVSYGLISVKNEKELNILIDKLPIELCKWVQANKISLGSSK